MHTIRFYFMYQFKYVVSVINSRKWRISKSTLVPSVEYTSPRTCLPVQSLQPAFLAHVLAIVLPFRRRASPVWENRAAAQNRYPALTGQKCDVRVNWIPSFAVQRTIVHPHHMIRTQLSTPATGQQVNTHISFTPERASRQGQPANEKTQLRAQ